jgi:hypothetical protein
MDKIEALINANRQRRIAEEIRITNDSFKRLSLLAGLGDFSSAPGHGSPVYLDDFESLRLCVWADINQEDPTHIIPLDGARESLRNQ